MSHAFSPFDSIDPQPPAPPADPRDLRLHRPPDQRDVPYVPTDEPVVAAMLRLAGLREDDVLYDLGCGDGRIVVSAARRGATAVGVDIDPIRVRESLERATKAGVRHRASFLRQSFFSLDLRPATVVTMYLLPAINVRLRPKLLYELRPGARVVTNYFDMGDWPADERVHVHHRTLHKHVIPAWVEGSWKCVVNAPGHRRHVALRLHRRYQSVWGTARVDRRDLPLFNGKVLGTELTFTLPDPRRPSSIVRYAATVENGHLRGTCRADGAEAHCAWGGSRLLR
jgi:SAM-dependent methyltransferase